MAFISSTYVGSNRTVTIPVEVDDLIVFLAQPGGFNSFSVTGSTKIAVTTHDPNTGDDYTNYVGYGKATAQSVVVSGTYIVVMVFRAQ